MGTGVADWLELDDVLLFSLGVARCQEWGKSAARRRKDMKEATKSAGE